MLREIRDAFNASLQHKEWMDPGTRAKAVEKLRKMFLEVGHPTVWPPATFETYEAFGGIGGGYFDNCVATNAREVKSTLKRLGTPVPPRPSPSPIIWLLALLFLLFLLRLLLRLRRLLVIVVLLLPPSPVGADGAAGVGGAG